MQRQTEFEEQIFSNSPERLDDQIKLVFRGDRLVEVEIPEECDKDFLDLFHRVTDIAHTIYTQNVKIEPAAA